MIVWIKELNVTGTFAGLTGEWEEVTERENEDRRFEHMRKWLTGELEEVKALACSARVFQASRAIPDAIDKLVEIHGVRFHVYACALTQLAETREQQTTIRLLPFDEIDYSKMEAIP